MRRVLFQWRGIKVFSYPAMLYSGVVAGVIGGTYGASVHGLDPGRVFPAMLLLVVAAIAGSRLCFAAIQWNEYRGNPGRFLRRSEGGAGQYGGLALAFLVSLPSLRLLNIPIGGFWDAGIVTILIGKVFTRFGCLLNGCCCGRPSGGLFTLYLPNVHGVWRRRIPMQLLEAALAALLLAASLYAWGRLSFGGAVFLGNLAAYGIARYWLEPLREGANRDSATRFNRAFSVGIVAASAGTFLVVWLLGLTTPLADPSALGAAPAIGSAASMSPVYLALTPLAILAVLSLFHFTGCQLVFPLNGPELCYEDEYDENILGETNTCDVKPNNSICVAYWRLGDSGPEMTPAVDSKGTNHGTFLTATLPPLPDTQLDQDQSPTTAVPPATKIAFQQPGLLGPGSQENLSIAVQGGFVRVPQTDNSLNLPKFTIEALVLPKWDLSQLGRWYCVVEHATRGPAGNKKFGVGIYAGPKSRGEPNTPYRWHVWLGSIVGGVTDFLQIKPITAPIMALPLVEANKVNYVAVTYDGTNVTLYSTFEGKFGTVDVKQENLIGLVEPVVFAPNQIPVPFQIGMGTDLFQPFNTAGDPRYPFFGGIQEVAVYNEALGGVRIASHIGAIQWEDL